MLFKGLTILRILACLLFMSAMWMVHRDNVQFVRVELKSASKVTIDTHYCGFRFVVGSYEVGRRMYLYIPDYATSVLIVISIFGDLGLRAWVARNRNGVVRSGLISRLAESYMFLYIVKSFALFLLIVVLIPSWGQSMITLQCIGIKSLPAEVELLGVRVTNFEYDDGLYGSISIPNYLTVIVLALAIYCQCWTLYVLTFNRRVYSFEVLTRRTGKGVTTH